MPPRTLTRSQFEQHPVAKRPGSSYENYLRFVARRRASALAAPAADPLAPTPEPVLRQQTTEAVRAQIDPILKEIMGDTNRAASGIELATQTHARRLEPFAGAARERFGRAAEATAGVAESLANRLAGKGAEAGQGLRAKLAAVNAPDRLTAEVAGGTEKFGRDASTAGFGIDSAALEEIISRGAGAEDFAAAMPGIANIAGVRSIGDVRSAGQRSVADVRGKIPGMVGNLMESARDREVQKGIAKLGLQETQIRTDAEAKADAAAASAAASKPSSALSNTLGYLVTEDGIPILDGSGQPIPTQGTLDGRKKAKDNRAASVKDRSAALVTAKADARKLARELFKGEKVKTGGGLVPGKETIKRKTTAEAVQAILNEIGPSLARYGVKPGTALWKQVREAVLDAVIDAGFPTGAAANPTKVRPGGQTIPPAKR